MSRGKNTEICVFYKSAKINGLCYDCAKVFTFRFAAVCILVHDTEMGKETAQDLDNIRRAVKAWKASPAKAGEMRHSLRALANEVGMTPQMMTEFLKERSGLGADNKVSLCDFLGLDLRTGQNLPSRIITLEVVRDPNWSSLTVGGNAVQSLIQEESVGSKSIPEKIQVNEAIGWAVIEALKRDLGPDGVRVLIAASRQGPKVAEAVAAVMGGDYVRAAQLCLALAQGNGDGNERK